MKKINRSLLVQAATFVAKKKTNKKWVPGLIHEDLWNAFEKLSLLASVGFLHLGKILKRGSWSFL